MLDTDGVRSCTKSKRRWNEAGAGYRADGNLYVTYTPMNSNTFETAYTDTCFVAVYSYPSMQFVKLMKSDMMGPGGSWNAFNGLLKDESDNLYVMSNSAISNGYSQSTKHAGFLRISKGATEFDSDYFFDFESATGGLKPAHITYIGGGKVFAEVSTLNPQTAADRWGDKSLKCCIIDLINKTVTDVEGIFNALEVLCRTASLRFLSMIFDNNHAKKRVSILLID